MNSTRYSTKDICFMAILAGWIAEYIWLLSGERYVQFIEKDLQPLLIIALCISALFLIALAIKPTGSSHTKSNISLWLNTGILLLPLIYTYAVPADGLDSYARIHRVPYVESSLHDKGISISNHDNSSLIPDQRKIKINYSDSIYTVSLTEIEMGIDSLTGENVRVIGRISRDTLLPDGYFFIYRFVITCCAAHAMPMSLPVVEDSNTLKIQDDEWIEVLGSVYPEMMPIGRFVFDSIPVIFPGEIKLIEPPENPYISSW